MGYAQTLLYGDNFQIGGPITQVEITDVIGDKDLGDITIPDDMIVKKAYLDLSIRAISSNSGGAFNWLNAQAALWATHGLGTGTSFELNAQSLYTFGSAVAPGVYIYGYSEIGSMFEPGEVTHITLANADALGASLWLWDVQPVVRIIMR